VALDDFMQHLTVCEAIEVTRCLMKMSLTFLKDNSTSGRQWDWRRTRSIAGTTLWLCRKAKRLSAVAW
jgi:hypothetical protein